MKRIVVRIISYNQENVIGRALESLLRQKKWGLYKIVVSDDCSKDGTWEILQDYKRKYPDIMDIHRNEHNLGIYGNLAKAETYLPDYDLFGSLAGDDTYCDGYFEAIQKFVDENNIDTNQAIGIYSDWKSVSPDGAIKIYQQDSILKGYKLWSLKIRGKISGRSLMMSKCVRNAFSPVLTGHGLNLTESDFDAQPHLNIQKAYYLPLVTTEYYTGIGVSSRLDLKNSDYLTAQVIEKWDYWMKHRSLDEVDRNFGMYERTKAAYLLKPSLLKLIKIPFFYKKGLLKGCSDSFNNMLKMYISLIIYGVKYIFKR